MRRIHPVAAMFLGLVAFVTVAILWQTGVLSALSRPAGNIVRSFSGWVYNIGSKLHGRFAPSHKIDPVALTADNELLRAENARLKALLAENLALSTALDYRDGKKDTFLVSRVVSASTNEAEKLLVIDRGSRAGIAKDQAVLAPNGMVLGKIFTVRTETATVLLLADSRSRIAVSILAEPELSGILEGDRGTASAIGLIPQGTNIPPGTSVVTAGLEPGIPRGLAVGTIGRIEQQGTDPFQKAFLTSSLVHSPFVQILIPPPLRETE